MKNSHMLFVLIPVVFVLNACMVVVDGDKSSKSSRSNSWEQIEKTNRDEIARLESGQALSTIMNTMGTPDFDESLKLGSETYRVLYYRTHRKVADGMTTRDECTPLVFRNGELVGWGDNQIKVLLEQARSLT